MEYLSADQALVSLRAVHRPMSAVVMLSLTVFRRQTTLS